MTASFAHLGSGRPDLPQMMRIRQLFDIPPAVDPAQAVAAELHQAGPRLDLRPGLKVAVGVGSRGIASLAEVVAAVVRGLRAAGAEPFIIPAMGSHGGATAQGQIEVLAHRGVTEAACGAPVVADMAVEELAPTPEGFPVLTSRLARHAEGLVLINRVKPHTELSGPTESGLVKMAAIGLGLQAGAERCHRLSLTHGMYRLISSVGRAVLARTNFLFGLGLVENQEHRLCRVRLLLPEEMEAGEAELLTEARRLLPGLPVAEVDLLIVDELGKDISGAGLDPNVIGRACCAYAQARPGPRVSRVFVRDLTEATAGVACGIGLADFTLRRLVDKIDAAATMVNALTACCPEDAKIPLAFATDAQALAAALACLPPRGPADLGLVHIKNTLEVRELLVSTAYLEELSVNPRVEILHRGAPLALDEAGNLASPWGSGTTR